MVSMGLTGYLITDVRFYPTFDHDLSFFAHLYPVFALLKGLFANDDTLPLCQANQTGCHIDCIADDGVVHAVLFPQVADDNLTGIDMPISKSNGT
jgi:hypothetical protein